MALFEGFKQPLPIPLVVVQHIRPHGVPPLVKALASRCCMPIEIVQEGDCLRAGVIYIASSNNQHLSILHHAQRGLVANYTDEEKSEHCRPAVNVLFASMARLAPQFKAIAVVLTGMGKDGAQGAEQLVKSGSVVIVQDESSAVVWGMPRAVVEVGAAHKVLSIEQIAIEIERLAAV
ncbi:MAG: chemotaxis protein CheB [Zetaproteobacteria bacterium]|nr:chemotaxis protein CheB [Zetaproteobacteria bacterium]